MKTTIKTKQWSPYGLGLASLMIVGSLAGCQTSSSTPTTSSSPSDSAAFKVALSSPEEAPAIISEIQQQPVWVRPLNASTDIAAQEGVGLRMGEKLRTQGIAGAQVDLKTGLALRIGGDSALTLRPDNQVNLSAGEMVTWVKPGQRLPVEIMAQGVRAKTQDATVSVEISPDPGGGVIVLPWEGTVTVQLLNQPGEVLLKAGNEVRIKKGETDIGQVRKSVRQLDYPEWLQRRFESTLLNTFGKPLPTLQAIEQAAPPVSSFVASAPLPPERVVPKPIRMNRPARRLTSQTNPVVVSRRPRPRSVAPVLPSPVGVSRPVRRPASNTVPENPRIEQLSPSELSSPMPTVSPTVSPIPQEAGTDRAFPLDAQIQQPTPAAENSPTLSPTPTEPFTPEATDPISRDRDSPDEEPSPTDPSYR